MIAADLDARLEELVRESGGPYVVASALFRLLDREEAGRSTAFVSYGTVTQDAILTRVARAVVHNANGSRERLAMLLEAVCEADGVAEYLRPVLALRRLNLDEAVPFCDDLTEIRPAPHYLDQQREIAQRLVAGGSR